jgi:5-carboxymethyl-2-hydroxymuconate isomerase
MQYLFGEIMPHCVIECPANLSELLSFATLVREIHDTTEESGLFNIGDVKSRLLLSHDYLVGGEKAPYVHIIVHILSGRSKSQRKSLADALARKLCEMLPTVEMLSVEVREIDKEMYSNRKSVEKT